jgi:hypothetical protein
LFAFWGLWFFEIVLTSFFAALLNAGSLQILHLAFVVLDKLGLLFFCLALLVFVAMWSRAITLMSGRENAGLVIAIIAIAFAVVIIAIVLYYTIVVSLTYINWFVGVLLVLLFLIEENRFYFDKVTDLADIILSCITCFLALCLLGLIIFVATKVNEMDNAEEKMHTIRLIGLGAIFMCLALIERVVIVCVFNFYDLVSLGWGVYYGLATILPEVIVCTGQ